MFPIFIRRHMPAFGRDIPAVAYCIPVIKPAIGVDISRIVIIITIGPRCQVKPFYAIGYVGYGIAAAVVGRLQVFGHPPLITYLYCLIDIAVDIGDCAPGWIELGIPPPVLRELDLALCPGGFFFPVWTLDYGMRCKIKITPTRVGRGNAIKVRMSAGTDVVSLVLIREFPEVVVCRGSPPI